MKALCLAVGIIFFISACEHSSSSSDNPPKAPNAPPGQKKVQPGDSLNFTCPDSFNKTIVKLKSDWDGNASEWRVSVDERDSSGHQVFASGNLVGLPDQTEVLHMNINDGSVLYATIVQNGEQDAIYNDGKRTLNCTFE